MTPLAEAYIHLKPFNAPPFLLEEHVAIISKIARGAAEKYYKKDVEIEVWIEPGSLRIWVRVKGTIVTSALIIAGTASVINAVEPLIDAAVWFDNTVIDGYFGETAPPENSTFRTERRTKIPGKINRTIERLEWLQENFDSLSPNEVNEELRRVQRALRSIAAQLGDEAEAHQVGEAISKFRLPALHYSPNDFVGLWAETHEGPYYMQVSEYSSPRLPPPAQLPIQPVVALTSNLVNRQRRYIFRI